MTTYITLPNGDRSVLESQRGTGNYTVKLSETFSCPGECECFLMSASIPYSWYNVNEKNNTLKMPGKTLRLPPGNYSDAASLVAAVSNILTAGETLTLDNRTMRSTLKISNDHTLSGPLLSLLGFSPTKTLGKGTHVSPNLVDVTSGINSLHIYTNIIKNTNVGSFLVPLLGSIPIGDALPGDIIQYRSAEPVETHALNTSSIQSIEIDIRDNRGRTLDFNNYDLSVQIGIRKTRQQ